MAAAEQPARRPQLSASNNYNNVRDIEEVRRTNDLRLKKRFESIFDKYERDFSEVGDVVDLRTGTIEIDNGHFRNMRSENDPGSRVRASRRVTVEDAVERHTGRRHESSTQSLQAYPPMHPPPPPHSAAAPPSFPHNMNQPYQPYQPYATYQQSVVSLPVMNGVQQFNPFDPNALVSLIDQRVQSQLAQYVPTPARRTPAIESRWRTPQRHSSGLAIRSPMPASPHSAQSRVSRSPSASSHRSVSSGGRSSDGRHSRESVTPERNDQGSPTEHGVWAGGERDANDEGFDAPEMGEEDDEPAEPGDSLWAMDADEDDPNDHRRSKGYTLTPWTKREILILIRLRCQGVKFRNIAEQLPGRTQRACCNCWIRLPDSKVYAPIVREQAAANPKVTKAWRAGWDNDIQPDQEAERHHQVFLNHLEEREKKRKSDGPSSHAKYTQEQDDLIMYLREVKKQPFRIIEKSVPGRTAKSLANRYYDILQYQKRLPLQHPPPDLPQESIPQPTRKPLPNTTPKTTHTPSRRVEKQPSHYPPPISEARRQSISLQIDPRLEDEGENVGGGEEPPDSALLSSPIQQAHHTTPYFSLQRVPDATQNESSNVLDEDPGEPEEPPPDTLPVLAPEAQKSAEPRSSSEKTRSVDVRRNNPREASVRKAAEAPDQPDKPAAVPQNIPKKRRIHAVVPDSSDSEGEVSPPPVPAKKTVRKVIRVSDVQSKAPSQSNAAAKKARVSLPARLHPPEDLASSEDELGI